MPWVEHGQIQYHTTQKSTFTKSKEESSRNESFIALHEAGEGTAESPAYEQSRQIVSSFEVFQDEVTGDVDADVGNVEHRQYDVEIRAFELQLFLEAHYSCIANVGSVDESQKPESEQPWYNVKVELAIDAFVEFWVGFQFIGESCVCLLSVTIDIVSVPVGKICLRLLRYRSVHLSSRQRKQIKQTRDRHRRHDGHIRMSAKPYSRTEAVPTVAGDKADSYAFITTTRQLAMSCGRAAKLLNIFIGVG